MSSNDGNKTHEGALSVHEACKLLDVHRNTLYRLIHEESLPAYRLSPGSRWRFRREDLERWIEDQRERAML